MIGMLGARMVECFTIFGRRQAFVERLHFVTTAFGPVWTRLHSMFWLATSTMDSLAYLTYLSDELMECCIIVLARYDN